MRIDNEAEQLSIYDLDLWCGEMFQEPSPAEHQKERISGSSSRRSSELKSVVFQSLDLTPGAGNLLGEFYWELISPWRGDALTLNTGVSPREEKESSFVADFAGRSARQILFDQESLPGHPAQSL